MKNILTLALTAALVFASFTPKAEAPEFSINGYYAITGQMYDNLKFQDRDITGATNNDGNNSNLYFDQRVNIDMFMKASEQLTAKLRVRAPSGAYWGASDGFDIGGSTELQIKHAFIDWFVPSTDISFRMGLQYSDLPTFLNVGANPLIDDDLAGVSMNAPINDNMRLIAKWFRPSYASTSASSYDFFALILPIQYDNYEIIPWAMYAMAGKNVGLGTDNTGLNAYGTNAFFPTSTENQSTYWLGFNSKFTIDQFTLGFEGLYNGTNFDYTSATTNENFNGSSAYLLDAYLSYATDYGTPGIFAWYASGDNSEGEYGRFVNVAGGWTNSTSAFYDKAMGLMPNSGSYGAAGTWGIGIKYSDFKPMDTLSLGGHIMYIKGTNNENNANVGDFTPNYLTTKDNITEFAVYALYDMYKELQIILECNYLLENLDEELWLAAGQKFSNGLRTGVTFVYSF